MNDNSVKKILILAANPIDSVRLSLEREVAEIRTTLQLSVNRYQFRIEPRGAVRPDELQQYMYDVQPQIVHFSGHGIGSGFANDDLPSSRKFTVISANDAQPEGLMFEDDKGRSQLVSGATLANLCALFSKQVECVVLNSCYSNEQAQEIVKYIPYVVGMNRAIGDIAARKFSQGFYRAIWDNRSTEEAFFSGINAIELEGIPEKLIPTLLRKGKAGESPHLPSNNFGDLGGQMPVDSPFYIERPPNEERCFEVIVKPGALIRIKAPRQMGKSSLMLRILERATQQEYRATWLNLQAAGENVLENLDNLLKWLCSRISRKLGIPDRVDDYWQGRLGCNDKCTDYFELYLLSELKVPFVLGLDDVDQLFQYETVAADFFGLLRSWHEESKFNPIWRNLRLVIAHSKEVYIPLNINQSPFNVGLPVELMPLNEKQIADLIQFHGLSLPPREVVKLIDLTGGHPYLLRVSLYYLARREITITELMKIAPTAEWVYGEHLRRHLNSLQEHPALLAAMKRTISFEAPVRIEATEAFKLSSMGLVRLQGNDVVPLCDLYRRYFREMLEDL